MIILTDDQIEEVRSLVEIEVGFRTRNPWVGRVTSFENHFGAIDTGIKGEAAYVAFRRDGMNTIETGKTTIVVGDDGSVFYGPTRDYAVTAIA